MYPFKYSFVYTLFQRFSSPLGWQLVVQEKLNIQLDLESLYSFYSSDTSDAKSRNPGNLHFLPRT